MRCCTRAEPTLWATTMDGWLITKLGRDWTRVGKPIPWPYSFTPFNRFWLGEATSLVAISCQAVLPSVVEAATDRTRCPSLKNVRCAMGALGWLP